MKKLYVLVLLIGGLLLTGCSMKATTGLEISKSGDVTVKMISAMDNEMIDSMLGMANSTTTEEEKTYTDKERWEYVDSNEDSESKEGYTKEKYDKDGFKGYTYSINLGNIDNLLSESSEKTAMDKINKDAKIFTKKGNSYILNIKNSDSNDLSTAKQYESMGAAFDIKFYITLPYKAKTNNATTVDGLTYTWDLLKTQDINLEFELQQSSNLTLILVGIGAILLVGACTTFIIMKSKKKKTNNINIS